MAVVTAALDEGAVVITANARLARAISLGFNRHQRDAGRPAWRAASVLPWQSWLADLWTLSAEADGAAGRRLLLTDTQVRAVWGEIIGDGPQLPGDRSTVAAAAARAWQLCQNWDLTARDLAAAVDSDDTRLFATWAGEYQARCRDREWTDSGMLPALLATDVREHRLHLPRSILFVGFDEWTPLQRELLRVVAGTGCLVREQGAPRADGRGARRISCHDRHDELETAARWARSRVEDDAAAMVGIVVPDLASDLSQVRRAFLDVFAPDWRLAESPVLPVNFSYGEPLARSGMVHAALLVLRSLAGSLDFRDAGQLLRTPYLPGSGVEAGARAGIDLELRERPGGQVPLELLVSLCASRAPLLAHALSPLVAASRSRPQGQGAAAWADTVQSALTACGWPGDRGLASDEYQAGTAWQEVLTTFRSCDRMAGGMDYPTALGLLQQLAAEQVFQPAGHPDAVQVIGVLEAIGQRFDALWICGLSSGEWPPGTRPDPLVPLALQRRLRMPDSSPPIARERAERRLRWLEGSAPEVLVSWPAFAGDEPLTASPLIGHLPECDRAGLSLWSVGLRCQALAMTDATEEVTDDPAPPVAETVTLRGGAGLLERQARCPARAFLEFRLGAREMRVPATGIDAVLRGTITHAVLQQLYRRCPGQEQIRALQADESQVLDEIIASEIRRLVPQTDALARHVAQEERQRLRRLIAEFLRAERSRPAFTVLATEQALDGGAGPPAIARLGIRLKADRIDALPDGRRLVIDYKTGQSLPARKDLWGPRPRAPQLPLYATLADADAIAFIGIGAGGIRWFGVGNGSWGIDGVVTPDDLTRNDVLEWGDLRAAWWSALERLGAEILEGDFRIDRWRREDAEGQWAMATRVYELRDDEGPEP